LGSDQELVLRAPLIRVEMRNAGSVVSHVLFLMLLAAEMVFLCAMPACAPSPKYRAHPLARPSEAVDPASPCGTAPALGVRLRAPVNDFRLSRVTSPFGYRASDGRRHDGVDIKARPGERIVAAASGVVTFSGRMDGYGNVVILDHGGGISTLYAHLSYILVRNGDRVGTGEPVGRAGKRGRATGTHLHFEVRRGNTPIDPLPHLCLDSGGG
jgi:murein DD-endopeptidase MepM/ murein hydrolase activator NlpD